MSDEINEYAFCLIVNYFTKAYVYLAISGDFVNMYEESDCTNFSLNDYMEELDKIKSTNNVYSYFEFDLVNENNVLRPTDENKTEIFTRSLEKFVSKLSFGETIFAIVIDVFDSNGTFNIYDVGFDEIDDAFNFKFELKNYFTIASKSTSSATVEYPENSFVSMASIKNASFVYDFNDGLYKLYLNNNLYFTYKVFDVKLIRNDIAERMREVGTEISEVDDKDFERKIAYMDDLNRLKSLMDTLV